MTSVGEILRSERESQGRGLAEIAEELCITQRYLRAIEQDDLQTLPGIFFYKSFVRQYAAILRIDHKTLQPGVDELTLAAEPAAPAVPDYRQPSSEHFLTGSRAPVRALDPIVEDGNRRYFPDRRIGLSVAGLVGVLLVCSGFYAWWNKAPQPVTVASAPIAVVPEKSAEPAPPPPQAPTVNVTTTTGADGVNHVVLNLSATEKTWLSITSDGKQIFSGVLEPSETKTLTGLEVAKLKVGNAAGLEVRWNGKAIGPIGPRGQVRVVLFTPENFQILSPSQTL
jgi:cytoskeleton protein RodZ